jgi:hypothetical protein
LRGEGWGEGNGFAGTRPGRRVTKNAPPGPAGFPRSGPPARPAT